MKNWEAFLLKVSKIYVIIAIPVCIISLIYLILLLIKNS